MKRGLPLALVLLAGGFALTLGVHPWSDQRINDLFVYRAFAEPVLHGALPYREAFLEYPPLAAPAIALPALAGGGEEGFRLAFAAWTLLLAVGVLLLTGALAQRTGGDRRRAWLAVALAPLLCGALIRTHFDLAPVALLLAGLLALSAGRPRAGLALLGLGAMTKGFPLVAAPIALAWLAARGERRAALEGLAVLAVVVLALAGVALLASPSGAADALRYQVDRPIQVESSPALTLLALDGLGLGEARSVNSHRSDGLEHPAAGVVSAGFGALLIGLLGLLTVAAARAPSPRALVLASLAAVTAFVLLGRVLSPQFLIWTLPLGALAWAWREYALAAALACATALTLVEFPAHYFDVVGREPGAVALVGARNALLAVALALAVRSVRRQQDLFDRERAPIGAGLDQDSVQPGVLV